MNGAPTQGLSAEGIVVRFGGLTAVDGVSLDAPSGRVTSLIGPNGAGKSTTFNVCCGFQRPDAGCVRLHGEAVTGMSPVERARLGIGRTFQRSEVFRSLSVRENVEFGVESLGIGRNPKHHLGIRRRPRAFRAAVHDRATELIERVGLGDVATRRVDELSAGHVRLVELARALGRTPTVLLLDEPSAGLDPGETEAFGRLLIDLARSDGLAILLVEHDMSLVLKISDWIHVLEFGRPLMAGTPADVRTDDRVRHAYLGAAV